MFYFTLIIPMVFVVLGFIFMFLSPKNMYNSVGWRTPSARKNVDNWKFANKLAGSIFFSFGLILVAIIITLVVNINSKVFSSVQGLSLSLIAIEALSILLIIFIVERALRQFSKK